MESRAGSERRIIGREQGPRTVACVGRRARAATRAKVSSGPGVPDLARGHRRAAAVRVLIAIEDTHRVYREAIGEFLGLEITESLLMEDIQANSRLLDELKTSVGGLEISIDDFGTGYS